MIWSAVHFFHDSTCLSIAFLEYRVTGHAAGQQMHMIGHDHAVSERVAVAVEVMQGIGDDSGQGWLTQHTGAVAGVEFVLQFP